MNKSGVDQLIYLFSKLPGLGSRSGRRIVLHLLQDKDIRLRGLIQGLEEAYSKINQCKICGNLDYAQICSICNNMNRNDSIIMVVETVAELWAIERSESFTGRYHVLGIGSGEVGSRDQHKLRLPQLIERCTGNNTKELVLAINSTLDGQTTAYFITEFFKDMPINVSRLASGIPIGGELDYLDEGTLAAAFSSRQKFE